MKNTLKNKLFDKTVEVLSEKHPEVGEAAARAVAHALAQMALDMLIENNAGLDKYMKDTVLEAENNKKMFRDHIEKLQKETKELLSNFRKMGFITYDWDEKARKQVLKARTTMVKDMVDFLNELSDFVVAFYKDVYKVEEDKVKQDPQFTLF